MVKGQLIPNFPGYFATKEGKIWSEPKGYHNKNGQFLKPLLGAHDYLVVNLCKNKKLFRRLIHRLVLETFVGLCPSGMQCRHLNGNHQDNRLENLSWGTQLENAQDRINHGNANKKLTEQEVKEIWKLWCSGLFTQKEIGEIYGVCNQNISCIVNGKTWKHIK